MTTRVFKYGPVDVSFGEHWTSILIPEFSDSFKVLHFAEQDGKLYFWAEMTDEKSLISGKFMAVGTGWSVPDNAIHKGTCQQGPFVWHLYMKNS